MRAARLAGRPHRGERFVKNALYIAKKMPNRTAAARLEKRINGNAPQVCSYG